MRRNRLIAATSMAAVLFLSACSAVQDGPAALGTRSNELSLAVGDRNDVYSLVPGVVNVCSFFPYMGTAEDFEPRRGTYTASAPAGENVLAGSFSIQNVPQCIEVWNASGSSLVPVSASMVSTYPGYELERIAVSEGDGVFDTGYNNIFNATSATVNVSDVRGAYIWFKFKKSELPPEGGEGCTPGYWKQTQHFPSWTGYSPDQAFSSVFADAFPGMTLLQVAGLGKGQLNSLGRHAVAALLNASSAGVSYDLTTQQVITEFNAAFTSGNLATIEELKRKLDMLNNQGCRLN